MTEMSLTQHFTNNAVALVVLAIADYGFIKPFVSKHERKLRGQRITRWFFVHSFANLFVVLSALHSLSIVLRDPVRCANGAIYTDRTFFGAASLWPLTIINSVHVYHMIGGFGLTSADYFHHLLFVPALGFPGQYYNWAALANWQAFFISGLPGGIDYFMLGLNKVGMLDHLVEKRVNANLNIWCRCPGILSSTVLAYIHVLQYDKPKTELEFICLLAQLILPGCAPLLPLPAASASAAWPRTQSSSLHPVLTCASLAHSPLASRLSPLATRLSPRVGTTPSTFASRPHPTTRCTTCSTCSGRTS